MAYHDDLLQQALMLVHREPRKPKQASLRRAVSAAYYALFHLLISEGVANWKRGNLRAKLSRAFDHGNMKETSTTTRKNQYPGEDPQVVAALKLVAQTFIQLQDKRHVADYDNATFWTKTDALAQVAAAQRAFTVWGTIRNEQIAQEYLMYLLVKKRR